MLAWAPLWWMVASLAGVGASSSTCDGEHWELAMSEPVAPAGEFCRELDTFVASLGELSCELLVEKLTELPYFRHIECRTRNARWILTGAPQHIVRGLLFENGVPFPLLERNVRRRLTIRSGVLLTRGRLKVTQERLERFLVQEGFFDPQVRLMPRPTREPGLPLPVEVAVSITGARTVSLGEVRLEGDGPLSAEEVKRALRHDWVPWLWEQRFQPRRFRDDLNDLEEQLREDGWPTARVAGDYKVDDSQANIRVRIDAGPRVNIIFEGVSRLSARTLEDEATFADAGAIDAFEVAHFEAKVINRYQRACFPQAAAQATAIPRGDTIEVVVAVEEGPKKAVQKVSVDGPEEILAVVEDVALLTEESGCFNACWVEVWVESDRRALAQAVQQAGYGDPSVSAERVVVEDGVEVRFEVVLIDKPRVVTRVELGGLDELEPELLATLPLQEGSPFSDVLLQEQDMRLRAELAQRGFLRAVVAPPVVQEGQGTERVEVEIRHDVVLGPKITMRGLSVVGNFRTSPQLLALALDLEPGAPLDAASVAVGAQELRDLGIFRSVNVQDLALNGGTDGWLVVGLQERPMPSLDVSVAFNSDDRLHVGFEFNDRNLWGRGMRLDAGAHWGNARAWGGPELRWGATDRAVLDLEQPLLFGTPWFFGLRADYSFENRPVLEQENVGVEVAVRRSFKPRLGCEACPNVYVRGSYRLSSELTDGIQVGGRERNTVARLRGVVRTSRLNSEIDPRTGYDTFLQLTLALPALAGPFSSNIGYWRILQQARWFLRFGIPWGYRDAEMGTQGGPLVLATEASLGVSQATAGGEQPVSQAFSYGSEGSVRGLAPKASLLAVEVPRYYARASLELRWYVAQGFGFGDLQLAAFVDGATVSRDLETLLEEVSVGVGPALRYVTPIGPLSVAYGWPVVRAPGIVVEDPSQIPRTGRLHLSLGGVF